MRLVANHGKYCVLACLESLLTDLGRPQSWEQIRDIFEPLGFCDHAGTVWTVDAFREGCQRLNLDTEKVSVGFPIPEIYNDGSLFLFFTCSSFHCVRVSNQRDAGKIGVMDPDFVRECRMLRWMDESEFSRVKPECVRVKARNAPPTGSGSTALPADA
jgi:hypothetical protein